MIEAAIAIGYEAMAITDHVWRSSAWVPAYALHLDSLKLKYRERIRLYSGIEAKVVSPDGYYSTATASGERWPKSAIVDNWLEAFFGLLDNPRVDVIAHPLSELKKFGIREEELPMTEITDRIADSGKILELNVRYNTPDQPVIRLSAHKGAALTISSDSHSVQDLSKNSRLVKEFMGIGFRVIDIHRYVSEKNSPAGSPRT